MIDQFEVAVATALWRNNEVTNILNSNDFDAIIFPNFHQCLCFDLKPSSPVVVPIQLEMLFVTSLDIYGFLKCRLIHALLSVFMVLIMKT